MATIAGCATRGQVRDRVALLEAKQANLERLEQRLDSINDALDQEEKALQARREVLAETSAQARLASDQATEAQELASGGLLGETVFRVDGLAFEPGTSTLTAESRSLLDQLAERLRAEDAGYYLEVQARGNDGDGAGEHLGGDRAEAVRRYLHHERGLPLHAVSTLAAAGAPPVAEPLAASLELEPAGDLSLAVIVVRPFPRP